MSLVQFILLLTQQQWLGKKRKKWMKKQGVFQSQLTDNRRVRKREVRVEGGGGGGKEVD